MRSFKDYTPNDSGASEKQTGNFSGTTSGVNAEMNTDSYTGGNGNGNAFSEGSSAAELTKKIAHAFNGRSSNDMMRSILAEAERSKREGRLSNEEIDTFYAQFAPLLDGVQRRKLKIVIDRLKRI